LGFRHTGAVFFFPLYLAIYSALYKFFINFRKLVDVRGYGDGAENTVEEHYRLLPNPNALLPSAMACRQ